MVHTPARGSGRDPTKVLGGANFLCARYPCNYVFILSGTPQHMLQSSYPLPGHAYLAGPERVEVRSGGKAANATHDPGVVGEHA